MQLPAGTNLNDKYNLGEEECRYRLRCLKNLKKIKMSNFGDDPSKWLLVEHLLGVAINLEYMVLVASPNLCMDKLPALRQRLKLLPKACALAEVEIQEFDYNIL